MDDVTQSLSQKNILVAHGPFLGVEVILSVATGDEEEGAAVFSAVYDLHAVFVAFDITGIVGIYHWLVLLMRPFYVGGDKEVHDSGIVKQESKPVTVVECVYNGPFITKTKTSMIE